MKVLNSYETYCIFRKQRDIIEFQKCVIEWALKVKGSKLSWPRYIRELLI